MTLVLALKHTPAQPGVQTLLSVLQLHAWKILIFNKSSTRAQWDCPQLPSLHGREGEFAFSPAKRSPLACVSGNGNHFLAEKFYFMTSEERV